MFTFTFWQKKNKLLMKHYNEVIFWYTMTRCGFKWVSIFSNACNPEVMRLENFSFAFIRLEEF